MATYVGDALLAHAHGGCYVCLRGDRLVDMDVQIEGEGALVICTGCLTAAAEAANITFNLSAVAEAEAAFVEERRHFQPERVTELEAELAEARRALELSEAATSTLQDALSRVAPKPKASKGAPPIPTKSTRG